MTRSSRIPTEVKRIGIEGLQISWSDGSVHRIPSRILRANCTSANSKVQRGEGGSHEKPLSGEMKAPAKLNVISSSLEEELSLERVWAIGNYAIGLRWADGHDSGIYSYQHLYELGELSAKSEVGQSNA